MVDAAPIARFALAYAAGAGAGLVGVPAWVAPLVLLASFGAPNRSSRRPDPPLTLALVLLAGWIVAARAAPECPVPTLEGAVELSGRFLATPRDGSAPFERDDGCGEVTVVVPLDRVEPGAVEPGVPLRLAGWWREGRVRPWFQARSVSRPAAAARTDAAARMDAVARTDEVAPAMGAVPTGLRWKAVRWRDDLVGRMHRLYGARGPLVAALVLARREGLDADVREAFAVVGIAHLLAISGFHVGVIGGLLSALLRLARWERRRAAVGSIAGVWGYTALIGLPDAAVRAALILTLVAASRARGTPPTRWGALGGAALLLLLADSAKLASPGFQLSFAGAAGLIAWERPVRGWLARRCRPLPRVVVSGLSAGIAATLATLPVVAWHFERISAVGIPVTLVASPLVALALPGAIVSLAMDVAASGLAAAAAASLHTPLGGPAGVLALALGGCAAFVAGGVSLLLACLVTLSQAVAGLSWASVWTSRSSVVAGCVGVLLATLAARRPGVGGAGRRAMTVSYALAAVIAWPILLSIEGRGGIELTMIDVGQGDAFALRSPAGRWLLVDAGPPPDGDARAHPVVRALRASGVGRLEALILTHADADHFGGAEAVLSAFTVGRVLDPALPVPKRAYADLIASAGRAGVPWTAARAGQSFDLDGVRVSVLHPAEDAARAAVAAAGPTGVSEANDLSVVVLVEWRGFRALLTGDAYVDVERALAEPVGDIDVLKVGHHGSTTSSDSSFLAVVRPELALVSAGRRNRYGHPAPEVLHRLEAAGARVIRTDLEGSVHVIVGRDGTVRTRSDGSR